MELPLCLGDALEILLRGRRWAAVSSVPPGAPGAWGGEPVGEHGDGVGRARSQSCELVQAVSSPHVIQFCFVFTLLVGGQEGGAEPELGVPRARPGRCACANTQGSWAPEQVH